MSDDSTFWKATKHPYTSFLFVFPLLAVYEVGVLLVGGKQADELRNGADHWLRSGLSMVGLRFFWIPPTLLVLFFIVWIIKRYKDCPWLRAFGYQATMLLESVCLALGLWIASRALAPLLQRMDGAWVLSTGQLTGWEQILPYLGAGIYEETIFRLLMFAPFFWFLRRLDLPTWLAFLLAATTSGVIFSAAHHVGPYGQEYSHFLFLFRLSAGIYFALIFELRGFGVAVGAHACYNVMVTVGA